MDQCCVTIIIALSGLYQNIIIATNTKLIMWICNNSLKKCKQLACNTSTGRKVHISHMRGQTNGLQV